MNRGRAGAGAGRMEGMVVSGKEAYLRGATIGGWPVSRRRPHQAGNCGNAADYRDDHTKRTFTIMKARKVRQGTSKLTYNDSTCSLKSSRRHFKT